MVSIKRELFVLVRVLLSFITAVLLIFFFSSLSGEDLIKNNDSVLKLKGLLKEINAELNGGIDQRIMQLGEVPERNPYRKFYSVELAKEIHQISQLTEKQRIMFDTYNVRNFEQQLKRMMRFTEAGEVNNLMDELEVVKRELKNSANLVDKRKTRLLRQRTAYIVFFFVLWIALYLYYSRGIIFRKSEALDAH
jgi:Fe2+ transport system protein B